MRSELVLGGLKYKTLTLILGLLVSIQKFCYIKSNMNRLQKLDMKYGSLNLLFLSRVLKNHWNYFVSFDTFILTCTHACHQTKFRTNNWVIDCLMVDAVSAIFQSSYNDQTNEDDLMIRIFSCTFFLFRMYCCFRNYITFQSKNSSIFWLHTHYKFNPSMMCLKLVSE